MIPLTVTAIVVALLLFSLHWFPWALLLNGGALHRLAAYTMGVAVILGVPTLAHQVAPMSAPNEVVWLFLASGAAGGAATLAAWAIDAALENHHLRVDARERAKSQRLPPAGEL